MAERSKAKDLGFLARARVKHSFSKERGFKSHRCQNRASNGLDERECALWFFVFLHPLNGDFPRFVNRRRRRRSSRVESSRVDPAECVGTHATRRRKSATRDDERRDWTSSIDARVETSADVARDLSSVRPLGAPRTSEARVD